MNHIMLICDSLTILVFFAHFLKINMKDYTAPSSWIRCIYFTYVFFLRNYCKQDLKILGLVFEQPCLHVILRLCDRWLKSFWWFWCQSKRVVLCYFLLISCNSFYFRHNGKIQGNYHLQNFFFQFRILITTLQLPTVTRR